MQKSKIILGSFPTTTQRYYDFQQEELIRINGIEEREVQTALIYCTCCSTQEFFKVRWETFKNQYWSTRMSETDKILHKKLDLITSDLQIIISPQGTLHDLTNVFEIQKKAESILNNLSHKYNGDNAQKVFKAYRNYYSHKKNIISSLCSYSAIGLLLPPYTAVPREVKNAKLIDNILFTINEKSKLITDTEIKITGKIQEQHDLSDLQALADLRKINIEKEDNPKLDEYEGIYHLQPDKSVKSASLSIRFSFGENYKKIIRYTLNTLSYEEI